MDIGIGFCECGYEDAGTEFDTEIGVDSEDGVTLDAGTYVGGFDTLG